VIAVRWELWTYNARGLPGRCQEEDGELKNAECGEVVATMLGTREKNPCRMTRQLNASCDASLDRQ